MNGTWQKILRDLVARAEREKLEKLRRESDAGASLTLELPEPELPPEPEEK